MLHLSVQAGDRFSSSSLPLFCPSFLWLCVLGWWECVRAREKDRATAQRRGGSRGIIWHSLMWKARKRAVHSEQGSSHKRVWRGSGTAVRDLERPEPCWEVKPATEIPLWPCSLCFSYQHVSSEWVTFLMAMCASEKRLFYNYELWTDLSVW